MAEEIVAKRRGGGKIMGYGTVGGCTGRGIKSEIWSVKKKSNNNNNNNSNNKADFPWGGYKKNEEVTNQEDLEISHKISSFQTECLPLLVPPLSFLHRDANMKPAE